MAMLVSGGTFSQQKHTEVVEIGQRDSGESVASAFFGVYLSLGSSFLPAWWKLG